MSKLSNLDRLKLALRDPNLALHYCLGGYESIAKLERKRAINSISKITGVSIEEVKKVYNESVNHNLPTPLNQSMMVNALELYVICRLTKPSLVLETGVGAGYSSLFILTALKENGLGHLWSLDLPNYESFLVSSSTEYTSKSPLADLKGKPPGWLVSPELRDRWTTIFMSVKDSLSYTLEILDKVDIFVHDSEHTYKNMMFEFETVWPHIKENGFLFSHDITWNKAFFDFSKRVECKPVKISHNFGVIKK